MQTTKSQSSVCASQESDTEAQDADETISLAMYSYHLNESIGYDMVLLGVVWLDMTPILFELTHACVFLSVFMLLELKIGSRIVDLCKFISYRSLATFGYCSELKVRCIFSILYVCTDKTVYAQMYSTDNVCIAMCQQWTGLQRRGGLQTPPPYHY